MKKLFTLFLIASLFLGIRIPAAVAFTGTINATCSNWDQVYGGASCSSAVWTVGAGQGFYCNNLTVATWPNCAQTNGQTIYITYKILSGSGTITVSESSGDGCHVLTGNQTNYAFTPSFGHTGISPVISSDCGATFSGTIGNLCFSTLATGCGGGATFIFWQFFGF